MEPIAEIFSSKKLPPVVSESSYVRKAFARAGFLTLAPNGAGSLGEAIFVPTEAQHVLTKAQLEDLFGTAAVLVIPLMAFASDERSIDYLLDQLGAIDFVAACEKNRQLVSMIEYATKPILVSSGSCQMEISIGSMPNVFLPKLVPKIDAGEWAVISQFLEVALIPNKDASSFHASGALSCDGISVAFHAENWRQAQPSAVAAWDLFRRLRLSDGFPLSIEVRESRIVSIASRGNEELLSSISPLVDGYVKGRLIEVSFASHASQCVDWSVNSQINEACGGVHLALGSGITGAHIDFIASRAIVS